jgi:hypothetical protein
MSSQTFTVTVAPAATQAPQYPTLLQGYIRKPPFPVAGVHYYVGCPSGIALKSPTAGNLPAGATRSGSEVQITGSGVTLDGYDCSGVAVFVSGANARIVNCKFNGQSIAGTQSSVIAGSSSSQNLYVGHCTINGETGKRAEFLVEMQGRGLTIERSWLRWSNSDLIGRHGGSGGSITFTRNLTEQAGMGGGGTHGDYLQVYGPTLDDTVVTYNTSIQDGGITQGWICDNTKRGEIGNNVMIGSVSYWVSVSGPGTTPGGFTGPMTVHDNFYDIREAMGFMYPSPPGNNPPVVTNNVNMVTG